MGRSVAGAIVQCMGRIELPLQFRLCGHNVSGVTLYADEADRVLVLASSSADLRIELRSAYLGGDDNPQVLVAEASTLPGEPTQLTHRALEDAAEVLVYERRRALYDHLQRLQELVAAASYGELEVTGVDKAVSELDPAHGVATRSEIH